MCFILTIGYGIIEVHNWLEKIMIEGWTDINLREKSKEDLQYKLSELDKVPWADLNDEEKVLYTQISYALDNTQISYAHDDLNKSSSVEDNLNTLGNIVIALGIVSCSVLVFFGILEEQFFYVIWGFAGILSSLISGYILKGLSKIIILLSADKDLDSNP